MVPEIVPRPTPIYHITHIDNLSSIVEANGLSSDAELARWEGFKCVSISYSHIKKRRMNTAVRDRADRPIAAGGVLGDYVPFYFTNRSPMLHAIKQGGVAGYTGGQAEIIDLVTSVERAVASRERRWFFTDGHAVERITEFLTDTEHLTKIDWVVINSSSWGNSDDDPDRKRRKQAEFLVNPSVPWNWFDRIGVIDSPMKRRVEGVIARFEHQPRVVVKPSWYYKQD